MGRTRHLVTGVEPVWVRIKYEWSSDGGIEEVTPMEFQDWVAAEDPEYECSCGEIIESYDNMIEHLERANTGRTPPGRDKKG